MLRAEAAVFTPKEGLADCGAPFDGTDCAEGSTAAPSPALTASDLAGSPMLSPYWGFETSDIDAATADPTLWNVAAAAAFYGGYLPDGCYLPEFALPDSEEQYDPNNIEPAYIGGPDFVLEGLEDLKSSIAGYFSVFPEATEDGEEETTTAPGLAPPPGLEAPPGLEDYADEVQAPPGLEGHSRAHKRSSKKDKEMESLVLPYGTTTAMLRNIPNKYTQLGLVDRLYDGGFKGQLDFIYLPIDFKNKCNVGYAFVNFRTAEACARFTAEYHGCNSREKLPGYNSKKICEVSAARFQGCEENIRRLQASSVMAELMATPDWLPMLFDESGEAVEFPLPDASKEVIQPSRSSRGRLQRRKAAATM